MDCAAAMLMGEEAELATNFLARVSAGSKQTAEALQLVAGSSLLLAVFCEGTFTELAKRTTEVFLPTIQDSAFRHCRYYLPLLDQASLASATPELLEKWLCGVHTYVRESAEDGGLLVLSRDPGVISLLRYSNGPSVHK